MTASRLVRFYPRAWRERYGTEFLEMTGPGRLTAQQTIDIAMGAIDAWLSSDVRHSASHRPTTTVNGGRSMMANVICRDTQFRMTVKDGLISASVLIASTIAMVAAGALAIRSGYPDLGALLKGIAAPAALLAAMPFGVLKGTPWRAQAAVLGMTLVILIAIEILPTPI